MDIDLLNQNKRTNTFQTMALIVGMWLVLGLIGFVVFGWWGAIGAIPASFLITALGPRVPPLVVLRLFKAQMIPPEKAPQLYEIHQVLCQRAGLDFVPPIYYIPSRAMNAFAAGVDDRSVVAISDGLLRALNPREIAGVLAHEISHIRHQDMKIMALADSFSRFASITTRIGLFLFLIAMLSGNWQGLWKLALLFLAPAATSLLQLALSRSREFNADMGAAELTQDPAGLSSALSKLERMRPKGWIRKILFPGNKAPEAAALRTHPPTAERVRRLEELVPKYDDMPNVIDVTNRKAARPLNYRKVRRRPGWHLSSGLWH